MRSSLSVTLSDAALLESRWQIWKVRPELREVYKSFFVELLDAVKGCEPVVEIGAGTGFFKQFYPGLVSTDLLVTPSVDIACDACRLPFRAGSVGSFVGLDVVHHLSRPLDFIHHVSDALAPGGRLAVIEPWITPLSYLLYRYLHHEDYNMKVDIRCPFPGNDKKALDGNAAIPFKLVEHLAREKKSPLRLVRIEPFLALPYLSTFGFKVSRPLPRWLLRAAVRIEALLGPAAKWGATRVLLVWEKARVEGAW